MRFIGITGGVGAGKTAILSYIEEHYNARIMLADEIAHVVMEPGTACNAALKNLFCGDNVFDEKGQIIREKMAEVIFRNQEKRNGLNAIVHPAVKEYVLETFGKEKKAGRLDYLVLEAALLIEEKYYDICDELWYIYTSEENRRVRLKESRGYSDEKIDQIYQSQLPEEIYRKYCRNVIDNNWGLEDTYQQLDQLLGDKKI